MPLIVGLTGGIGSGKSAAAKLFAALGASVVDTDVVSHGLTGVGGAAVPALRQTFGDQLVTGEGALDRPAMRHLVFSDPLARSRLEAILHPLIRQESARQCATATGPYVLLVVPLLLETSDYRQRVARVAVVDCPETVQIERVMSRSGLAREEVLRIMAAQIARSARLQAADDVIANDASLDQLQTQVAALHSRYLALAAEIA